MLIGFSVSKCFADILEGKVDPDDVMIIIGGTYFDRDSMDELIDEYTCHPRAPWYHYDKAKIKTLLVDFWVQGKIHQPRLFGPQPPRMPRSKKWMRLINEQSDMPQAAQDAWDKFVVLASLYGAKHDKGTG